MPDGSEFQTATLKPQEAKLVRTLAQSVIIPSVTVIVCDTRLPFIRLHQCSMSWCYNAS